MTAKRTRTVEDLRRALGADVPARVRRTGHGPFGVLALSADIAARLRPGAGGRPGRPTDPAWELRRLVGFRRETWEALGEIAERASTAERQVSPAQVAAVLIEEGVARLRRS
jgi:hypothetical protein